MPPYKFWMECRTPQSKSATDSKMNSQRAMKRILASSQSGGEKLLVEKYATESKL